MGDLLAILSAAQSSLGAQRGLTATASHNIANANNPDYARQTANVEALVPADEVGGAYLGRGSVLGSVTQARDRYLEAQLPSAFGNAARSTAESDALQAFHALDPGAGLDAAISGFYSALRALQQNPADSGLRAVALGATRAMGQAFNRTAQQIESARSGLDARTAGLVATIDGEARAVAELNVQIRQASASGSPNDLLDLRQKHVDELATLTGATPVQTADGDVNLLVGTVSLVAGANAGSLVASADPRDDGHLQIGFASSDGSTTIPLAGAAVGGTLGGTLAARDGALKKAGDRIDDLAFDLATAINDENGYDPAAGTGQVFSFATNPADPTDHTRAAATLTLRISDPALLAPSIDPVRKPGDPTRVLALLTTENATVAGASGAQGALSSIVSDFGASASTAKAFADQDGSLRDELVKMRASTSGVSIDDEMITIQAAQRGYEALAKVIAAADQMMQTLMGIIR